MNIYIFNPMHFCPIMNLELPRTNKMRQGSTYVLKFFRCQTEQLALVLACFIFGGDICF